MTVILPQSGAVAVDRGLLLGRLQGAAVRRPHVKALDLLFYAVFALLIGLPLALVLVQAVLPDLFDHRASSAAFSVRALAQTFASARVARSVVNSLALAATVAVTATALGGAFAFLVRRCRLPLRGAIAVVPWLVFLTPSYLKALAWALLMAPGGYLVQLGLPARVAAAFFSLPGLVFVHTLSLFPLAFFIIGSALVGLGSDMEDAGRLSGAAPFRVWMKINAPLIAPAIALSAIATFAEVLADFGMATTIARMSNFSVLTYGIYAATSDYPIDFPMAGTQAFVLILLVAIVVGADRLLRRQVAARLISGRSKPPRIYDLKRWSPFAMGFVAVITFAALVLPLGAIALRALTRTIGASLTWETFTLDNLAEVATSAGDAHAALLRSLGYASLAAVLACSLALLLALRLERDKAMRPVVLGLALGTVAIPGIVLGFGYILVWNRLPGFRDLPFPRYGEGSLLILGYVAAALPYCLVIILSAIGQLAPNLGDAARLFGVGPTARLLRLTLPLIAVSVVTALLMTFIHTIFELPMSQMLIPLDGPPAPTMILRYFNDEREGPASALSLASMVIAGGAAALIWSAARRMLFAGGATGSRRAL
ncbi:ABC transporter permease [Chelatococcus sp. GCM10030263]|uniref:ABC transporter permease n=1 Tax=Chelatococcus sp. GCM10030263 TaxID=3273387 RepID=UPI00360B8D8B